MMYLGNKNKCCSKKIKGRDFTERDQRFLKLTSRTLSKISINLKGLTRLKHLNNYKRNSIIKKKFLLSRKSNNL